MVPEIRESGSLICPQCGNENLHQFLTEVYDREQDSETGVRVVVLEGEATFSTSMDGNPSHRRNGLRIKFYCEHCAAKSVMTICQHKGTTYVDMDIQPVKKIRRVK